MEGDNSSPFYNRYDPSTSESSTPRDEQLPTRNPTPTPPNNQWWLTSSIERDSRTRYDQATVQSSPNSSLQNGIRSSIGSASGGSSPLSSGSSPPSDGVIASYERSSSSDLEIAVLEQAITAYVLSPSGSSQETSPQVDINNIRQSLIDSRDLSLSSSSRAGTSSSKPLKTPSRCSIQKRPVKPRANASRSYQRSPSSDLQNVNPRRSGSTIRTYQTPPISSQSRARASNAYRAFPTCSSQNSLHPRAVSTKNAYEMLNSSLQNFFRQWDANANAYAISPRHNSQNLSRHAITNTISNAYETKPIHNPQNFTFGTDPNASLQDMIHQFFIDAYLESQSSQRQNSSRGKGNTASTSSVISQNFLLQEENACKDTYEASSHQIRNNASNAYLPSSSGSSHLLQANNTSTNACEASSSSTSHNLPSRMESTSCRTRQSILQDRLEPSSEMSLYDHQHIIQEYAFEHPIELQNAEMNNNQMNLPDQQPNEDEPNSSQPCDIFWALDDANFLSMEKEVTSDPNLRGMYNHIKLEIAAKSAIQVINVKHENLMEMINRDYIDLDTFNSRIRVNTLKVQIYKIIQDGMNNASEEYERGIYLKIDNLLNENARLMEQIVVINNNIRKAYFEMQTLVSDRQKLEK